MWYLSAFNQWSHYCWALLWIIVYFRFFFGVEVLSNIGITRWKSKACLRTAFYFIEYNLILIIIHFQMTKIKQYSFIDTYSRFILHIIRIGKVFTFWRALITTFIYTQMICKTFLFVDEFLYFLFLHFYHFIVFI